MSLKDAVNMLDKIDDYVILIFEIASLFTITFILLKAWN